ncbi:MAG TPA: TIGR03087 family PEP-CTERM/XrtA system glycosyltransferase [Vicinamibacterales bacterium]|nr:TIGR03087 family PEP-CTERM/XrtA system glycosyltransferase [Vicinamibacterales bacterium]
MRILFLTHRLPYAPNRGDRLRAYHMLQHLRTGADVELLSLVHDDDEAAHVASVREFVPHVTAVRVPRWWTRVNAAAALPTRRPLTHALLDAPGIAAALHEIVSQRRPDVVFAYCSGMARLALQAPLADIPLVLDFVDVDSQKWRELSAESRWPRSWIYRREAATLGAFEARAAAHASASLVVNPREAAIARALAPTANVQVLSNGVEVDRLRRLEPPSASTQVVFCGVMDYAPNDEGMRWFVREVWPLVRARRDDATLAIVGSGPTQALRELCAADAAITVTGRVPDVREWLWTSAVGIAPLHVARGVQNKALEAIAAGLPIVITEAVAGGLPPEAAHACLVANSPQLFANHVVDLLTRTPQQRLAMAAAADFTRLTWSRTLEPLLPLLERAAKSGSAANGSSIATVQEFCTHTSQQPTNL